MSDEEAEAESTVDRERGVESPPSGEDRNSTVDGRSSVDRAAESFVALEAELRGLLGGVDAQYGYAEDVERVPASAVPADYPVSIASETALRLRVLPDDAVTEGSGVEPWVYAAWPPDDDGPLARLMALRDVDPESFADLHGERIPLAVEDGFLVLRVPPAGRRGSPLGVYGVLFGLGVNLAALGLVAAGAGSLLASIPAVVVLVLANLVALPLGTYLDGWHLLGTTDWDHGPPFWAALALLPGINVLTTIAYLYTRQQAEPL